MTDPSRDPSIEHEPHLQEQTLAGDPSEQIARETLRSESRRQAADDAVEHSVWDEPGLSAELAGVPGEDEVTYARWLARKLAETS